MEVPETPNPIKEEKEEDITTNNNTTSLNNSTNNNNKKKSKAETFPLPILLGSPFNTPPRNLVFKAGADSEDWETPKSHLEAKAKVKQGLGNRPTRRELSRKNQLKRRTEVIKNQETNGGSNAKQQSSTSANPFVDSRTEGAVKANTNTNRKRKHQSELEGGFEKAGESKKRKLRAEKGDWGALGFQREDFEEKKMQKSPLVFLKGDAHNKDIKKGTGLDEMEESRFDWFGTSQFYVDETIKEGNAKRLEILKGQRDILLQERVSTDIYYDPYHFIFLSYVEIQLGYSDVAAGNAHRALLLIEAALDDSDGVKNFMGMIEMRGSKQPTSKNANELPASDKAILHARVQFDLLTRLSTDSEFIIKDELNTLRCQAYENLTAALIGCGAFWDGLKVVAKALKLYPTDVALLAVKRELGSGFRARNEALPAEGVKLQDRRAFTRSGKIFQKGYPFIENKLYVRNNQLVREVNETFAGAGCEVRKAFFGQTAEEDAQMDVEGKINEDQDVDVGPLGVFATRDIKTGELIMVDRSITGVSDVSPTAVLHCDACHASLSIPYTHPKDIVKYDCCEKVAFCSQTCHDLAIRYHKVLCGKDFTWLYEADKGAAFDFHTRWRPIMFLRIMAIIISDYRDEKTGEMTRNPLAHPLLAQMTAAYQPAGVAIPETLHDWQYFENVVAPTRILQQLGVQIFEEVAAFSQEVIQTIYWRLENNANQTKTRLIPDKPDVHMVSINLNYLFFNHSCIPNCSWHGTAPDPGVNVEWLRGMDGSILKPGESAVSVIAGRDISKGEELKISYIGDPLGEGKEDGEEGKVGSGRAAKRLMLNKWCEGGCGCEICEGENMEARRTAENNMDLKGVANGGETKVDSVKAAEVGKVAKEVAVGA